MLAHNFGGISCKPEITAEKRRRAGLLTTKEILEPAKASSRTPAEKTRGDYARGFLFGQMFRTPFPGRIRTCYSVGMPLSMTERVQELRQEIADISKESADFLRTGRKDAFSLGGQERRIQRLQEIKEELISLTAWKKL